jgi:hypothetical protein
VVSVIILLILASSSLDPVNAVGVEDLAKFDAKEGGMKPGRSVVLFGRDPFASGTRLTMTEVFLGIISASSA